MMNRYVLLILFAFLANPVTSAWADYSDIVLADNPIFYWSFNETDGNAQDLVSGDPANALVPINGAARGIVDSQLFLGNAAVFNGANQGFLVEDLTGNVLEGSSYVIEFWYKGRPDPENYNYILEFGAPGTPNRPTIYNDPGPADENTGVKPHPGAIRLLGNGPTGWGNTEGNTDFAITDTLFHHVLIGFYADDTGAVVRIVGLIDGIQKTVDMGNYYMPLYLDQYLAVGNEYAMASGYTGAIDELAIYDLGASMTSGNFDAAIAQLATHYAQGQVPVELSTFSLD